MNEISKYLLKKIKERRPDDTLYALAKRIGMNRGTIHNSFKSRFAWAQCENLFRICSDIGVSMEEVLLREEIHKKNDWKEKYFESERKYKELESKYKKLKSDLKNLQ